MFLILACFVAVAWAVEVSNLKTVRRSVTAISGASLPELVDAQKTLLSIENLRRFAEVAYVSRTQKSRREARLSAREIVAETVFLSSEALHEDALRVSRIIDAIVRNRTGIEKEQETIASSSVIYLQAVETLGPHLRTTQERQAVFGLFLDFFLSPREDFSTRSPEEMGLAFQRHIREVQVVVDSISPSLPPASRGVLAEAMRNIDSSLHAIGESSRVMESANQELNEHWVEIDQLLKRMRDSTRMGGEAAVESALGAIGKVADTSLRIAYVLFAVMVVLIALDFALLYVFVNRPLRWTTRKLMEIQEGVLDTPAPVIRVREVAILARLLDRFAGRLGELYRQSGELEEAAAAKNDLEEVMRAVFMASLDGYVVWHGDKAELVSPMTLKLLGADAREDFAAGPGGFGFTAARLKELMDMATFEKSVREEASLRDRGGRAVPVELTHLPVRFRGRGCLLTCIRDLRRQKRSEEALRVAKVQAEVAATAKSEFLANMSHEIMTPLNGILGLTRVTLAGKLDSAQQERLRKVEGEARRLVSVMHDILDYSAMDSGRMGRERTVFTLERVMKSVMDGRAADAEAKGVELFMKIPAGIPGPDARQVSSEVSGQAGGRSQGVLSGKLSGDARLLSKVLDRLVDNAVKFTDRGFVSLEAEACAVGPDAVGPDAVGSDAVGPDAPGPDAGVPDVGGHGTADILFTVRDTGMGIPPGGEEGLFSPFSQADGTAARRHGGTGLGLSFAKKAVENMGGRIWFESATGGGSVFRFTARFRHVPASGGAASGGAGASGAAGAAGADGVLAGTGGKDGGRDAASAFRGRRAVVCAPESPGRDALLECLNGYFREVQTAGVPEEALAILEGSPVPDCLLADLKTPGALAFIAGLAGRYREGAPRLPVILMGPRASARTVDSSLYTCYLEKPCSPGTLHEALAKAYALQG
jgi:signal transduction histidine kinase